MAQRNAAGQIWPHLQSGERPEQQQRGPGLAASMWPSQTPEAKARDAFAKRNWRQHTRAVDDATPLAALQMGGFVGLLAFIILTLSRKKKPIAIREP